MQDEAKSHSTDSTSSLQANSVSTNCQNCKKDFTIETEDFNFYEKIKVPAPTWCPECRMVRRLNSANGWSLFYRDCDNCGKRTLSMYPPSQKITVYCQPCWWGDSWDGSEYAMDYDSSRPFLVQLEELSKDTPYAALETEYLTLKNCDYSNAMSHCKDCTLTVWADYCEFTYYSSILNNLKYSSDCLRAQESELCYESTGIEKCYQTFFSEECDACVNVWFSKNCYSCTNCVGCVNLRGASHYIFNVKYSKEEYEEKVKELNLESWSSLQSLDEQSRKFWLTKPKREYNGNSLNKNVTGDCVFNSKNSKEMYICVGAENCKWCQFITVAPAKDCMDYSGWANNAELIYESASIGNNVSNVKFSSYCFPDVVNVEYSFRAIAGKNNFGCMNLKRKQYCILNKEYSREVYEELKMQIIEDMKNNPYIDKLGRVWSYGEFFQPAFNIFAYNNSNAMKFFPKTKEQALKEGYFWNDEENPSPASTIESSLLPDKISETNESVLNEIISCKDCKRSYRIVKGELDLLRKMNLPIPHECPKCRENKRFSRMNKPGMYHRNCDKCKIEIYTPYASERPEIVYCVKCYQQEFI